MTAIDKICSVLLPVFQARLKIEAEDMQKLIAEGKLKITRPCGETTLVMDVREESVHYPVTVKFPVVRFMLLLTPEAEANGCSQEGRVWADESYAAVEQMKDRPEPPTARFFVTVEGRGQRRAVYKKP